jgi:O-antigen ligase
MQFDNLQARLIKTGAYSFVLWVFTIYFSTALAIFLSAVLALLWLGSGQFLKLPQLLKSYPVALWSLLLFACFIIGFSYGDAPHSDAVAMLKKYRELLFIPILMPFLSEQHYRCWAWSAFMIASLITLLGSQFLSLDLVCANRFCTPYFKSSITHSIFIAFFAFFMLHKTFDSRGYLQVLYLAMLAACLHNLFFISIGRTGQLTFIGLLGLFAWQRLSKKNVLLTMLIIVIALAGFIGFSDKASRIRTGFAAAQARLHDQSQGEHSMSDRFTFWKYSVQLIAEKPLFGQGTGNFTQSYQRLSGQLTDNPHNEFLLITVQLGIFGLLFYLGFLASQYYYAAALPNPDRWLTQGLLLTLVITSLFNSPLLDHTEGHWFTMMIALCFAAKETKIES